MPPGTLKRLLDKKALSPYTYGDLQIVRIRHDADGVSRGAVVLPAELIVHSFPRIKRILHLENGIKRYFKDADFFAEEKIDGYNVRAVFAEGRLLAFTRGGFVCPFTVDRLPDLINISFLKDNPGYVLCGEMAGPENPYNTEPVAYIKEDVKFFGFDIMDGGGSLLPADEKTSLFREYGIEHVRRWGPFTTRDIPEIREIVSGLNEDGREGLVLKSPSGRGEMVKYVTAGSCLRDVESTAGLMAEIPPGYYLQRLWRSIFSAQESGLRADDPFLLRFIKSLYVENLELLRCIEKGGSITEDFQIRVTKPQVAEELLLHLKRAGVRARIISMEKVQGHWKARIQRTYIKGTRELAGRLKGRGFYD